MHDTLQCPREHANPAKARTRPNVAGWHLWRPRPPALRPTSGPSLLRCVWWCCWASAAVYSSGALASPHPPPPARPRPDHTPLPLPTPRISWQRSQICVAHSLSHLAAGSVLARDSAPGTLADTQVDALRSAVNPSAVCTDLLWRELPARGPPARVEPTAGPTSSEMHCDGPAARPLSRLSPPWKCLRLPCYCRCAAMKSA